MTTTTAKTTRTGGAGALMLTSWLLATLLSVGAQSPTPTPSVSTVYAPSPLAEGPAPDCIAVLVANMSDCQSYVMAGSNLMTPEKGCCGELAYLVDTTPQCLCELLAKGPDYGVDVKRALKLPTLCSVSTPPTSTCEVIGIHIPSESPMSSVSPGMSPEGLASSPSAGKDGLSRAPIVTHSAISLVLALAIAFFPMIISF